MKNGVAEDKHKIVLFSRDSFISTDIGLRINRNSELPKDNIL